MYDSSKVSKSERATKPAREKSCSRLFRNNAAQRKLVVVKAVLLRRTVTLFTGFSVAKRSSSICFLCVYTDRMIALLNRLVLDEPFACFLFVAGFFLIS